MRTLVAVLIVAGLVIAGFYAYRHWVPAPGAADPGETNTPGVTDARKEPVAATDNEKAAELLRQARAAAKEGQSAKARTLYEQLATGYAETWSGREANLELGNIYLKDGRKKEALDALQKGLANVEEAQRPRILETIKQLQREVAGKPAGGEVAGKPGETPKAESNDIMHLVRRGDTLVGIAKQYNVSLEQLKLANNRTDGVLKLGDTVCVSKQMPVIKVSKKDLKLQLFFKGKFVKEYPVGIGKDGLTPTGEFTVTTKVKNPDWYKNGTLRIPYGDARNILGTRWMTLMGADKVQHGYGIHGTTIPASVPGQTSAGCIRMLNENVEELYEWVPPATHVSIVDE